MEKQSPLLGHEGKQASSTTVAAPRHVWNILLLNTANNFAFYGISGVLFDFLTTSIGFSVATSVFITNTTLALAYASSLLGVAFARRAGIIRTLITASCCTLLGLLAVTASQLLSATLLRQGCFFFGLLLVALGYGGVNPFTSVLMGHQFTPSNRHLMSRYFSYWYCSVQLGAIVSMLGTSSLLADAPRYMAFAVLAAVQAAALAIFLLPVRHYRIPKADDNTATATATAIATATGSSTSRLVGIMLRRACCRRPGVEQGYSERELSHATLLARVARLIFIPTSAYCCLYFQMFSLWQVTATSLSPRLAGLMLPASDVLALDPFFVLSFTPLLVGVFYKARCCTSQLALPVQRMVRGLGLAVGTFVTAALLQAGVAHFVGSSLSLLLMVPQFALNALSELLFMATGIEFAYAVAPASLKGAVTAMWWLGVALGTQIIAVVVAATGGPRTAWSLCWWYLGSAVGMVFITALFYVLSRPLAGVRCDGDDDEEDDDAQSVV